ncbi:3-oxo-Delta(4,5)-steroid 5-beta-reductase [Hordeum vulgare]|nr:3-oxo-Delta(4,5)-steroid 5-beta-reductase [Hordeum vulgare]
MLPPWSPPTSNNVMHLRLDLADPTSISEVLAPLTDITYVFYDAWSSYPSEEQNKEANSAMLPNVLSVPKRNPILT